jgi:hypothetical protein
VPKYYAQFDVDNFILAPTPDAGYVVDIHYLYRPASLTAGSDAGTSLARMKNLGEAQEPIDEYRYGTLQIPRT